MSTEFNGDNKKLIASISALLALDAKGCLAPHGIGEHARVLLQACEARLPERNYPSEAELIANGLGYPVGKEDAVKLHYAGYRSEVITILEAWEAIGHDIHINPDKQELMESLRNMAAICAAHGFDMPAEQHQGEPIMLTAVADLVDDGDGGLEARWLLEGGTAELFAGMTLLVADNAPDLCSDDGRAEVYTHADAGEVDRLRDALGCALKSAENVNAEAVALRIQLSEHQWHYEPYDDHYHRDAGHYCPSCGGEQDSGHKSGCDIAKALSASAGQEKEA